MTTTARLYRVRGGDGRHIVVEAANPAEADQRARALGQLDGGAVSITLEPDASGGDQEASPKLDEDLAEAMRGLEQAKGGRA